MSQSARKQEQQEAIERLREWLKPGDTVYTILRHVSRSGMQRVIGVKLIHDGNRRCGMDGIAELSYNVALALDMRFDRDREGVKIGGCGTDMGFEIVYNLGRALWPDGFGCIGEKCRSNAHSNGDRNYTPHGGVGGCKAKKQPCTCHDPSAWKPFGPEHVLPYPNGCSTCGCHRIEHWHRDGGYALQQRWL